MKYLTLEELKESIKGKDFEFEVRKFGQEVMGYDAKIFISEELCRKSGYGDSVLSISDKLNLSKELNLDNFNIFLSFKTDIDGYRYYHRVSAKNVNTLVKIIDYLKLNVSIENEEKIKDILRKDCEEIEGSLKVLNKYVKPEYKKIYCCICGSEAPSKDGIITTFIRGSKEVCFSCFHEKEALPEKNMFCVEHNQLNEFGDLKADFI